MKIPIYKPWLSGNESKYVKMALDSTWISSKGSFIDKFEKSFAEYTNISNCLTVSNGTVALHLALLALGIGEGDEVIVPTLTYIASVNCIKYVGANPIFVDSDPINWQQSIYEVEKKISPKTKAIIAVHLYGFVCNTLELKKIANKNKIFLIEDCAEALGSRINNCHVGNNGDISTFSFYGNKTITTGEGGMVATNNIDLARKVFKLKTQGVSEKKVYWHDIVGYNYRMTNICAAIGLAQLENIEKILDKKKNIYKLYKEFLSFNEVIFQEEQNQIQEISSFWIISVVFKKQIDCDLLRCFLLEKGIETRPIFYPIHKMPMYLDGNLSNFFPNAENISKNGISLPSFPELSRNDVKYITQQIIEFIQNN